MRFTRNTWVSIEAFNVLNAKNQASVNWIKTLTNVEYALPNNLTGRRINLRFKNRFLTMLTPKWNAAFLTIDNFYLHFKKKF
ncbi:MAG: hypothetical protein IPG79_06380 [Saprospiraceae bacterium]|nr:hypothetical protein [Saprospiraceae bacterium]